MFHPEVVILLIMMVAGLVLVWRDAKSALYVLLLLSVFLHKEVFSIYRWDVLPIRVFSMSFALVVLLRVARWLHATGLRQKNPRKIVTRVRMFFSEPFTLLLGLLWVSRLVSLLFTKNHTASIFLFGFFTTVLVFSFFMIHYLKGNNDLVIKLVKFYVSVAFVLSMIAYVQWYVYESTGFIFGALWNIPGRVPRLGSLFWDTNHFGAFLAFLLPVLGSFVLTASSMKKRLLYLLMFLPSVLVLLLTSSRTSWIAAFVAFGFFVTLFFVRRWGHRGILILLVAFLVVAMPLVIEYSDRESPFRAKIKGYFHYRIDSFDSHLLLIQGTLQVFEEYPVFGGGYGGFFEHFSKTKVAPTLFARDPAALTTRVPAHTIWGELLAETGIVGFSTYLLFSLYLISCGVYVVLTKKTTKSVKKVGFLGFLTENSEVIISASMVSSYIGIMFAGIFYSYNSEFFWILTTLYFVYFSNQLVGVSVSDIAYHIIKKSNFLFYSLVFVSIGLLFIGLGSTALIPWDEAIYAKVAKNMVVNGEYLDMTWKSGKIWYEKPPFYMWSMSFFMNLLGFSSWSARLPSAVFGFLTVLMTYFFGKKLFSKGVGFMAGFILLTTFHFLYYSRSSMIDVTATFFITSSLFAYYLASESRRSGYWALAGLLTGFAVLSKGVVGFLALPVILIFEFYLFAAKNQKVSKILLINYLVLLLSSVAVFLPWHLYMFFKHGSAFVENYLGYHVIARATKDIEDKGQPFFWYVTVAKVSMRVWFGALLGSLPIVIYRVITKDKKFVFLFVWLLFVFLFFSVSKSKLIWYLIPIYPVASIVGAFFLDRVIEFVRGRFGMGAYVFRFLAIYAMFIFGFFYLFLEKNLVYVGDLTGAQAHLLEYKDKNFGVGEKLYVDTVELPLVLFYTDGPFEEVDYRTLERKLQSASSSGERLVFLTKESRFENYAESIPNVKSIRKRGDYILGAHVLPVPEDMEPVLIENLR